MSWDTEVIDRTRYIIGDLDTPYKYSDSRIKSTAAVSAKYMIKEITFTTEYSVVSGEVVPDPTSLNPIDEDFLNLLALKTSVLITGAEVRMYAMDSIKVMDGPSMIDMTMAYKNVKDLNIDLSARYEKQKTLYIMNGSGYGHAITTPTTQSSIYTELL